MEHQTVSVEDVGLFDHFLLRWEVDSTRTIPSAAHICSRPWRQLDLESFRSALFASKLCQPDEWHADVDDMATTYDSELNAQLDRLLPLWQFDRRQRPSDPWFDKECRAAKPSTRRLERAFPAASRLAAIATTFADCNAADTVAEAAAAKTAWYNQRRFYRQLRHNKSAEFWRGKLEANQSDPPKLWKIVDDLLGRGRGTVSYAIDVEVFNQCFTEKVADEGC